MKDFRFWHMMKAFVDCVKDVVKQVVYGVFGRADDDDDTSSLSSIRSSLWPDNVLSQRAKMGRGRKLEKDNVLKFVAMEKIPNNTNVWQQQKQQLLHSPSFQTWADTADLKHLSQLDRISLINSLLKDSHEDSSTFIKKVRNRIDRQVIRIT
jgi:hypothetical protein